MTRYLAEHLLIGGADTAIVGPGVVDVLDGTITWSGTASDAPSTDERVVSIGGLLMPAFVNAHAHTPMTLFRGAGEGLPVDRWLETVMWPREARLVAEDVTAGMRLGCAEQLTNGTATTHEMYFHPESMIIASRETGMRTIVTAPFIESEQFRDVGTVAEQLEKTLELARRFDGNPMVGIGLGPHSAYAMSDGMLRHTAELAEEHGLAIHIHLAELPNENELLSDRGRSAAAVLEEYGLLRPDTVGAHGVWLDDADIALVATRGTSIVHCPVSNARHGMGVAPLAALKAGGVTVGLGTDGPASQSRVDMFEAMRQAILLQRATTLDGAAMTSADALLMATAGSADALTRPDLGRLAVGCRADMVHIDLDSPSMGPILDDEDIVTSVVWAGSREAVSDVWVDGRHVVVGGHVTTVDAAEARADVHRRAARLAQP